MKRFEKGKTYYCRMTVDYDSVLYYYIDRRTKKSVWITGGVDQHHKRRKVTSRDGVEFIDPEGRFSMSPILRADKPEEEAKK